MKNLTNAVGPDSSEMVGSHHFMIIGAPSGHDYLSCPAIDFSFIWTKENAGDEQASFGFLMNLYEPSVANRVLEMAARFQPAG